MTTAELKSSLHDKIDKIKDDEILESLDEMLSDNLEYDIKLEQWQLDRIEKSKKQIENGEFYTEEQSNEIVKKWLKD